MKVAGPLRCGCEREDSAARKMPALPQTQSAGTYLNPRVAFAVEERAYDPLEGARGYLRRRRCGPGTSRGGS
eukprot:9693109-Alexandrium_andersonii.AAC.1